MRKIVGLILVVMLAMPVVWAQEVKELSIYWNPDHLYKAYDAVINEFASEKGLKINKQILNWADFRTKIQADFAAGTPPDLIEVPSPWIAEFGAMGQLYDLTDEVTAWPDHEDWFESTWVETSARERIYGLKLHHTVFGVFYNRQHFRDAGLDPDAPPATLEEFVEVVHTLTDNLGAQQIQGFGFDPTGQYLIPFLANAETPLLIRDGQIAIDTPTTRNTLQTLQALARSGKVFIPEPGGEEARQSVRLLFFSGKISMMISGPWELGNIKNNFPDLDFSVAMIPHLAGVDGRSLTAGVGLAIPQAAKAPKPLVWELVQRLTALDTLVAATLEAGMLMPRKTWADDPRVQDDAAVRLFGKILPMGEPFDIDVRKVGLPEITWGGSVFNTLYQTMIYSDKDMNQALDAYIAEANRLLSAQ